MMKVALCTACLGLVLAQVSVKGRFRPSSYSDVAGQKSMLATNVPYQDNEYLLAEAEAEGDLCLAEPLPFKFGKSIPLNLNLEEDGEWNYHNLPDGTFLRRWSTFIRSPGATTISLYFDAFYLLEGGEFYVITPTVHLHIYLSIIF